MHEGGPKMAWLNDKKIVGIYVYGPQNRNVFISIDGVGWRQLWAEHDCQSEAMAVMAANARAENRSVNVYEENAVIKVMYVF